MNTSNKYLLSIFVLIGGISSISHGSFEGQWDIFDNSHNTRRLANNYEMAMAIRVGGCSGFLLGPTIGMSAAHCVESGMAGKVYSGIALRDRLPADGRVTETLEVGSIRTADYWIFKIEWNDGKFPKGIRLIPYVQTRKNQLKVGENDLADMLYTLGFPGDISQGRVIYSWGFGKSDGARDNLIRNNISLINGNSGGAIVRRSDNMLISVVSGGPHMLHQPGWEDNDWNDSQHWNWGPAIWKVYAVSKSLQALFPAGNLNYYYQLVKKKQQRSWGVEDADFSDIELPEGLPEGFSFTGEDFDLAG